MYLCDLVLIICLHEREQCLIRLYRTIMIIHAMEYNYRSNQKVIKSSIDPFSVMYDVNCHTKSVFHVTCTYSSF